MRLSAVIGWLLSMVTFLSAAVIRHPHYKSRNTGLFRIDSIETETEFTCVHLSCGGGDFRWAEISPDIYLTDGGFLKLKAVDMDGTDPGRRFLLPDSGSVALAVYFPVLPDSVERISLLHEGLDPWMIKDISLGNAGPDERLPARFRGNWLDTSGGNSWILGLWDEVALWKGDFWDYLEIKEKEKELLVRLGNGKKQEEITLKLRPGESSLLQTGRRKTVPVSRAASYDNLKGSRNRGHKREILPLEPDRAMVRGYLKGYDSALGMDTVTLYSDNLITGESRVMMFKITPRGTFEMPLAIDYPVQQTLFFKKGYLNFYLEPGDDLMLFADVEELVTPVRSADRLEAVTTAVRYMGVSERINRELRAYRLLPHVPVPISRTPAPDYYKEIVTGVFHDEVSRLDHFVDSLDISATAARILRLNLQYAFARRLLDYERYYTMRDGEGTCAFPESYYGFLNHLPSDDLFSLSAAEYRLFIDRLENCRPVLECRRWTIETLLDGFRNEGKPLSGPDEELVRFSLGLKNWSDTLHFQNYAARMYDFNEKYGSLQKLIREKMWIGKIRETLFPESGVSLPLHVQLLYTRRFASRRRNLRHPLTDRETELYKKSVSDARLYRIAEQKTAVRTQ